MQIREELIHPTAAARLGIAPPMEPPLQPEVSARPSVSWHANRPASELQLILLAWVSSCSNVNSIDCALTRRLSYQTGRSASFL